MVRKKLEWIGCNLPRHCSPCLIKPYKNLSQRWHRCMEEKLYSERRCCSEAPAPPPHPEAVKKEVIFYNTAILLFKTLSSYHGCALVVLIGNILHFFVFFNLLFFTILIFTIKIIRKKKARKMPDILDYSSPW